MSVNEVASNDTSQVPSYKHEWFMEEDLIAKPLK